MATQKWGNGVGEVAENVTTAVGAAVAKTVEVTVDLSATAVGGTRKITYDEVRLCLERIMDSMGRTGWPPA